MSGRVRRDCSTKRHRAFLGVLYAVRRRPAILPRARKELRMRRFALLFFVVCFGLALSAQDSDSLQLQQVVLVSRHGVRSPTNTKPPLAQVAAEPWPTWDVPAGELTPRGAQLATIMGSYYRAAFADADLLTTSGCPRANDVYAWSDVEQRTSHTAQALLD